MLSATLSETMDLVTLLTMCVNNLLHRLPVGIVSGQDMYIFVAIVRPLRPRMSKVAAYAILTSVWLAGGALSCPSLIYSTTMTFRYADKGQRTICYLVWPDGPAGHSYADYM
ncbi:tachykinin-like peptides receptor 99D [Caerostris darwini]|uniref:Tachykinin-like peptides receptor 99D n=1 Tax=Caerostris darwini TaxID=1538125 RepID=A0AAV4PGJ7_9ARAC|nr:tachykinin-like peptides receptor 99D [Caerostris darwini]